MNQNYKLAQQLIAYIVIVSLLLLQSCGNFSNLPVPVPIQPIKTIETVDNSVSLEKVLGKKLTAQEGHQVTFYTEHGQWQAEIKENVPIGFSKIYQLPVYLSPDRRIEQIANLSKAEQKSFIHVHLPRKYQRGYVYVGQEGLKGGMQQTGVAEKGKQKVTTYKQLDGTANNDKTSTKKVDDEPTDQVSGTMDTLPKPSPNSICASTSPVIQFFSPYVYAGNNPVILADPSGQFSWVAFGSILGGIVAMVGGVKLAMDAMRAKKPILVGSPVVASALIGGGLSSTVYGTRHMYGGFGTKNLVIMIGLGSVLGAVSGGISSGISSLKLSTAASFGSNLLVGMGLGILGGYVTNGAFNGIWTGKRAVLAAALGAVSGLAVGTANGTFTTLPVPRSALVRPVVTPNEAATRIQKAYRWRLARARLQLNRALHTPSNKRQGNFNIIKTGVPGDVNRIIQPDEVHATRYRYNLATKKYTSYIQYDQYGGPLRRVDVTGAAHGRIDTPHVLEFQRVLRDTPRGPLAQYSTPPGNAVRPAHWWELPFD